MDRRCVRMAAAAPAALLAGRQLLVLAGAVLLAIRRRRASPLALVVVLVVCAHAVAIAQSPRSGPAVLGDGVAIVHEREATVVVLDNPRRPQAVLERLR
ncbi:MAG: hypothetical protein P8J50_19095 [Acidimicrobiales bacterium]|nr:hypothetical protein [Acidimicrobiales bacterium]